MIALNLHDVKETPQFRPSCEFVFAVVFKLHGFLLTLTQLVISSQNMDPVHKNFSDYPTNQKSEIT
jgi:hypothetical protein